MGRVKKMEREKMEEKYIVFNQKVAAKLMLLGYRATIEENYLNADFYVFKFKKTCLYICKQIWKAQ